MKGIEGIKYYSPIEEKINIISHAIGLTLSVIASVFLVIYANLYGDGWHIVSFSIFAIKPLMNILPLDGFLWLLAGGISYTIGAILYSIKKIKYNHAIFHVFVLSGSFCQFMSVFFYVLPWEQIAN